MGRGIADGLNTIGGLLFCIPYAIIVIFSIYKFTQNEFEFENKWLWTVVHTTPFLIGVWYIIANFIQNNI
ncbi:hypothetical protein [Maribacter sp. 2-571]|uniref:hypothetical protein n=1 Tax=Maribacter sp. 2-571 TaxID=3417569 RepID=UPI003D34D963